LKTSENDNNHYGEIIDKVLKSSSKQSSIDFIENLPPKSVIYSITGAFSFIFGLGILCEILESGKIRWKTIILGFIILILILAIVYSLIMKERAVEEHEYEYAYETYGDTYIANCENFPCEDIPNWYW